MSKKPRRTYSGAALFFFVLLFSFNLYSADQHTLRPDGTLVVVNAGMAQALTYQSGSTVQMFIVASNAFYKIPITPSFALFWNNLKLNNQNLTINTNGTCYLLEMHEKVVSGAVSCEYDFGTTVLPEYVGSMIGQDNPGKQWTSWAFGYGIFFGASVVAFSYGFKLLKTVSDESDDV